VAVVGLAGCATAPAWTPTGDPVTDGQRRSPMARSGPGVVAVPTALAAMRRNQFAEAKALLDEHW